MAAVRVLLFLLALLLSARGDVRARDPEVEREEDEAEDWGEAEGVVSATEETPLMQDGGNYPARSGNWCAFVQKRTVTTAVACGTEKYTIKSQSPCPSGTPDCHLVMYKLSTRPLYRQKQKVTTALLWRCCPGHGGYNCDDTGVLPQQQHSDPNREQNDHQGSVNTLHNVSRVQSQDDRAQHQDHVQDPVHVPSQDRAQYPIHVPHQGNVRYPARVQDQEHVPHTAPKHEPQERLHPGTYEDAAAAAAAAALPLPHMVALLMSQLQPALQHFNRSLELLGRQVSHLARDVARLEGDESVRQAAALRRRLESELHSQHAMLHYNISNLKTDLDLKLKRHNKMLHASLQAMNASLADIKLEQEQEREEEERRGAEAGPPREVARLTMSQTSSSSSSAAVWEAIERLDNTVVNNSIKVDELAEDLAETSSGVRQLRRDAEALGERVDRTARSGQVLFMETGLEVEAAKVAVLERVEQLAGNLSRQVQRLHEMDVDVDYLYAVLYKNNSSECDCRRLDEALARLEMGVVNATELANENRLASEAAARALRESLRQAKESMTSEHDRTTALESSVRHLSVLAREVRARAGSEETERVLAEMKRLSASFNSLLKDAIRHSDVLEILLGEEVLEFLEWPVQDQEAHSIPALKEHLRILQRTLGGRNLSLAADEPGDTEEAPPADEPSRWSPGGATRNDGGGGGPSGDRPRRTGGDGGDLWKLERSVEELKMKLRQMEEAVADEEQQQQQEEVSALRTEVARLERGLEEHLRTFRNVFSNADVLERSRAALELDKLQQMLATKEKKKRGGGGGGGRGGQHRSRRQAPDVPATLDRSASSTLPPAATFDDPPPNPGHLRPDAGTFRAPADGVYVFTLAVDVRPPDARVLPRAVARSAGLRLREGEELRLELRGGERDDAVLPPRDT
ncbi:multimerin-2a isoform X2 [Phyllopteryx taeniolatus]|uniref:multimerin-2a isoform X2 n=1 Tax=Phyllopteryx taeniolatus TaxID=161469 RepID=UPI002AD20577|nr:multimerin-2a isoform X2 [Phyllopteryx taeniolatus]